MKVLMLGWELPPQITGGLGVACQGLLDSLSRREGISIDFVLPRLGGAEKAGRARIVSADRKNVTGQLNDATEKTRATNIGAYCGDSIKAAFVYADNVRGLLGDAAALDIVHAHDWLTFCAAIRVKDAFGCHFVAHVHSTEIERAGARQNTAIVEIERRGLAEADRIVTVSDRTRRIIVEQYDIDPNKVDVVYNAADHHPYQPPVRRFGQPVVSFIGRVTWQKGPSCFVEAAYRVARRIPGVKFVLAGEGDQLMMTKALCAARGLTQCMDFPGFMSHKDVMDLLSKSSVYVMPSVAEPFGIGALEAIRSGIPVVLSNACGVTEVVTHVQCVDPEDVDSFADAIISYVFQPEKAMQEALLAQEDISGLSWFGAAEAVHQIYLRLMNSRGQESADMTYFVSSSGVNHVDA